MTEAERNQVLKEVAEYFDPQPLGVFFTGQEVAVIVRGMMGPNLTLVEVREPT